MAIARYHQIDISVAGWYHCMLRCVRPKTCVGWQERASGCKASVGS